ncbi:MAG: CapA family protein [Candidatus Paceibacterota bacterium]
MVPLTTLRFSIGILTLFIIIFNLKTFDFNNFSHLIWPSTSYGASIYLQETDFILSKKEEKSDKIFFVGDVMLARHVETLMKREGDDYPFKNFTSLFKKNSYLVGNFEASIPIFHKPTKNNHLNFSVNKNYTEILSRYGFTHLSLANNHSYDFGLSGYKNTIFMLENQNISVFGNPNKSEISSVNFLNLDKSRIALVGLNDTYGNLNRSDVNKLFNWINNYSDLQIVYIHWGNEYELENSNEQRNLATYLVEIGADMIVGHHPHVVQPIEIINDKLVFYSLGNFIFDQYFDTTVQTGLVLEISKNSNNEFLIDLLPVDNSTNLSQPNLMKLSQKNVFLQQLSANSNKDLKTQILNSQIILDKNLATSQKTVIMAI